MGAQPVEQREKIGIEDERSGDMWSLPPLVKAILGSGAVAYLAGLLTTTVNAAHQGFLLPELTKTQTVWAGGFRR